MKNDLGSAEVRVSEFLPEQSKVLKKYNRNNILNSLSSVNFDNKFAELGLHPFLK
jgi:hypothetical protein